MTIQVFDEAAAVSALNRAFNDASPAYAIFQNQVASAKNSAPTYAAFANAFGASFAGISNAALAKQVLTNMGILTAADTSITPLEQALTDYFAAYGSKTVGSNGQVAADTRGFIVLQLCNILAGLETATGSQAVYNKAAVAWNSEVAASYTYSSNTANTTPTSTGSTGQTLNLTVNQDNAVGGTGDDTINGVAVLNGAGKLSDTLQGVDTIDGGAGNDTLNVTLSGATTVTPSMKAVENVVVRFTNGDTLDLGSSTGVTAVTVANGTSSGTVSNIGDANSLSIKNQTSGPISIDGAAGSATTLALNLDTVGTKTATAVTPLVLDLGVTNASKVTTANITMNNAYVDVNSTAADVVTTATIAATGTNTLLFSDSKTTLTKITVTGDGSVNLMGTPATPNTIALSKVTTLDASAVKGAVTAELSHATAAITVTTNAGDDYIKVSTVGANGSSASLGAGNDTLIVGDKLANFGKGVNGGDGTDIINLTTSLTTSTDSKLITNFETLDVSGTTANATYDVSLNNFPTVQIDEAIGGALAGTVTFDKAPDTFTLTVASKKQASGSATTVFDAAKAVTVVGKDFAGTTANGDAETFSLVAKLVDGNKDGTIQGNIFDAGVLTVGDTAANSKGVENLNITTTVTVDGGATATSNVASNYVYTPNIAIPAVEVITIKGDATVNFAGSTFASNAINKVDASASNGNVVYASAYSNASMTYLGAAGVDTYTASGKGDSLYTAKGGDQITLAGGRDTLVYKAATDSQITDINKDGKMTLGLDMGVAGTITTGTYIALPTATMDSIGTFTVSSGSAANASSDRIDVTNFAFAGAQRGVENVTAKVSSTTDLTSITGLFAGTAGNRGVAFTNLTSGGNDTYVFIDANKDGNFTAADDIVIKLTGVANINETDFNF